jgi:hypothetical protein
MGPAESLSMGSVTPISSWKARASALPMAWATSKRRLLATSRACSGPWSW